MFTKLKAIIYYADDLEKAKEWYTTITGITPYFDETFYVGFSIYGCELGLHPEENRKGNGEHSVAYWSVDDIEDAFKSLVSHGAKIIEAIQSAGDTIKVATVEDPFGNHIGLIEEAS